MADIKTRSRTQVVARVLVPILAVSWFVAVFVLTFQAIGETLTFFGEQPTAAEEAASGQYWNAALVVAVVLPLVGLATAAVGRSRAGQIVFVVLLLLGFGLTAVSGAEYHRDHRNDPPPPQSQSRGSACQEHSGGDNRCPGG